MTPSPSTQSEWRYRCAECGHGAHLFAWSEGVFEGPLGADGLLERHDYAEDTFVFEGSIRCNVHGDTVTIHKFDGEMWCIWTRCTRCEYGRTRGPHYTEVTCRECQGSNGAWRPVEVAVHG